eukprot:464048-Rhodomonas_salina.2
MDSARALKSVTVEQRRPIHRCRASHLAVGILTWCTAGPSSTEGSRCSGRTWRRGGSPRSRAS